jgi:hypothetical protein
LNLDDFLPPHPFLPHNRFWLPIRVFEHAVIPLLPYSEELLYPVAELPPAVKFDAIADDEIDEWEVSPFNVGLLCGKLSNATVLQVTTHSAQLWLDEQELPRTPQWLSRRSRYYLFNHVPDGLCDPVTDIRPGVRLLNDGAYAIYPGSIYDDGRLVYWEESPDWAEVADLPQWLVPAAGLTVLPA